jgi:hypothetical protein
LTGQWSVKFKYWCVLFSLSNVEMLTGQWSVKFKYWCVLFSLSNVEMLPGQWSVKFKYWCVLFYLGGSRSSSTSESDGLMSSKQVIIKCNKIKIRSPHLVHLTQRVIGYLNKLFN